MISLSHWGMFNAKNIPARYWPIKWGHTDELFDLSDAEIRKQWADLGVLAGMKSAITITPITDENRESIIEQMCGMSREEAFRCQWSDCKKPGEVYLGYRQDHLVCADCANRPELKRFKHRNLRSEVEWWNAEAADSSGIRQMNKG